MPRTLISWAVLSLFALIAIAAGPESLEGRWVLVEQEYERGSRNLADLENAVVLEFAPTPVGLSARIWAGGDESAAVSWPAMVGDGGPAPLEVLHRAVDPAEGTARAHYRVVPSPADELVLDIVESYGVDRETGQLAGTVTVTFTVEGEERGSFVLRRRFERDAR